MHVYESDEIIHCLTLTHSGGLERGGNFWRASRMLQFCLEPEGTSDVPAGPGSQVFVAVRLCLNARYSEREQAKKLDEQNRQEAFHGNG